MKNVCWTVLVAVVLVSMASAQRRSRVAGTFGNAAAGTAFNVQVNYVVNGPLLAAVTAPGLVIRHTPLAFSHKVVAVLNDQLRREGLDGLGYCVTLPQRADRRTRYIGAFELKLPGAETVNDILVGPLISPPGATGTVPQTPGVMFQPEFFDGEAPPFISPSNGSSSVQLRIAGSSPNDDFFHLIEVPIGSYDIETQAPGAQNYLIAVGSYAPGAFPLGGASPVQIDISSPMVLADGIGRTTTPFVATAANGLSVMNVPTAMTASGADLRTLHYSTSQSAIQNIVVDPARPPFALVSTPAANIRFEDGAPPSTVMTGPDGVIQVVLGAGKTFDFYGQTYSDLYVHENGFITFGSPSSLGSGALIDPILAEDLEPAIFGNWGDWDGSVGAGVTISELGDKLTVAWGLTDAPISHAGDSDQAAFQIDLRLTVGGMPGPDSNQVLIQNRVLDPTAFFGNDLVIGITAGNDLDPTPLNLDLGEENFAPNPFDSLFEQHRRNATGTTLSELPVVSGGPALFNDGFTVRERSIAFMPPVNAMSGYVAIPTISKPNAAQSLVNSIVPLSGGTATIIGQFKYFGIVSPSSGNVVLDPNGLAITLTVNGVLDSSNSHPMALPLQTGFRDFEGLEVQVPPLPLVTGTTLDIEVNFDNGETILIPGALTTL